MASGILQVDSEPEFPLHAPDRPSEERDDDGRKLTGSEGERYQYDEAGRLRTREEAYGPTPDELQELKQMTHQIEKSDAARLKCLIELAALRNIPLDDLIKQLGLRPYPHD